MLTINDLQRFSEIVKISVLADKAGLNGNTISTKLSKNRELTVIESDLLASVLKEYGFTELPTKTNTIPKDYKFKSELTWRSLERSRGIYYLPGMPATYGKKQYVIELTGAVGGEQAPLRFEEVLGKSSFRRFITESDILPDISFLVQVDKANFERMQKSMPDGLEINQECDVFYMTDRSQSKAVIFIEGNIGDEFDEEYIKYFV